MSIGRRSPEVTLLHRIDRFGVEAVTGRRVLYLREINSMLAAEDVYVAYRSRKTSANWGEWEQKNPELAKILIKIEIENVRIDPE